MSHYSRLLAIVISTLLLGCSLQPSVEAQQPSLLAQRSVNLGQKLPISAQAIIADRKIELEVARTRQQQATGLMYRNSLPNNRGMLFLFEPPQVVSFWMKNVRIPLDMVFLLNGKVQAIAPSVPPCQAEPCPTYGPNKPVNQVIELRSGRAAELGIKVGEQVNIKFFNSKP